jgi:hypothetical protein
MIELRENKEKDDFAKGRVLIWDKLPCIHKLWKNESERLKLECAIMLDNQASFLARLSDDQLNDLLEKHHFESAEECLENVIQLYKDFSKKENLDVVALQTGRDVIPYRNAVRDADYMVSCRETSYEDIDVVLKAAKHAVLGILVPFMASRQNKPCMFADWFLSDIKKDADASALIEPLPEGAQAAIYESDEPYKSEESFK